MNIREEVVNNCPCNGTIYLVREFGNKETMQKAKEYWVSKTSTNGSLEIYDNSTYMFSEKVIHKSNKGYYITKNGKRYYLQDFVRANKEG